MNSGSWASYQAALPHEARAGGERDDEPTKSQTIPEKVTPEHRYAVKVGHTWDVFDWIDEGCECLGRTVGDDGYPQPDKSCRACNGTGKGGLVPDLVAAGVFEGDARLLVFGGDLLAACKAALVDLVTVTALTGSQDAGQPTIDALRAAIARATKS
jgi:hypothetical protein